MVVVKSELESALIDIDVEPSDLMDILVSKTVSSFIEDIADLEILDR